MSAASYDRKQIEQLQRIILDMDEEIEGLKQKLKIFAPVSFVTPLSWRLTTSEERVLRELSSRTMATRAQLLSATRDLPGAWDIEEPNPKGIDVRILKMRKKLRPLGFQIVTIRGRGWSIEPAQRRAIIDACNGAAQ